MKKVLYEKGNKYFEQMKLYKNSEDYAEELKLKKLKKEKDIEKANSHNVKDKSIDYLAEMHRNRLMSNNFNTFSPFDSPMKINKKPLDLEVFVKTEVKQLKENYGNFGSVRNSRKAESESDGADKWMIENINKLDSIAMNKEKNMSNGYGTSGFKSFNTRTTQDVLDDYYLKAIRAKLSYLDNEN